MFVAELLAADIAAKRLPRRVSWEFLLLYQIESIVSRESSTSTGLGLCKQKQNSKFRQILRQSPWTQTRCLWITYRSPVFWEAAAYKLSWIWVWWLLCVDYCTHACEYRTNAGIRKIVADSGSSVSDIWLAWTAKWSRFGGQVGVRSFGKCTGYRQVLFLQSSECVKRGYLRKSASADPALTLKLVQFCVEKSHDQKGKKRNWTEGVTQGHLTTRAEDLYRFLNPTGCNQLKGGCR